MSLSITKAYRYRLYPTKQDERLLMQTLGCVRFVWNRYLDKQKKAYFKDGERLNYHDHSRDLTVLKRTEGYEWLRDVNAHVLQQSLRDLDTAYGNFFEKRAQYPKFKKRYAGRQSFRKPEAPHFVDNKLFIQRDMVIKARGTRPPEDAKLGSVTVTKTPSGKWYASIVAEELIEPKGPKSAPVGIDLGLKDLVITSDGHKYPAEHSGRELVARKRFLQRVLAHKAKHSNNRQRARSRLALVEEKIVNRRSNHLHHVSRAIADKNHAVVVAESLAVVNMMKNHKLARSIQEASWGELLRQVEYKQRWSGGEFVKIDRFFPSSKTCSNCDYILDSLPLSVRVWTCPHCHAEHDRDVNAAKNILRQGLGDSLKVRRRKRRVGASQDMPRVTTLLRY
jgi:putative transposase